MSIRTYLVVAMALPVIALAAGNDNTVEWNGVSHITWLDRDPVCPVDGEAFTITFQTFRWDITAAYVYVLEGETGQWIDAYWSHENGAYDIWKADLPATTSTTYSYYIALQDGSDTDYLGASGVSDDLPDIWFDMNYSTMSHAPLGCTPTSDGGAVFKLWAPDTTSCFLAGTFNGWNMSSGPMTQDGSYFIRRQTGAVPAGGQYKFVLWGDTWKPDARALRLNPSDNYNSYVVDTKAYSWGDQSFRTPSFEEMIVYQLHVGTFSGRNDGGSTPGTYRNVVDLHLQHLVDLGVNCVQLCPITEFPWDYSAGYNPVTQFAPEWKYGNTDDLKYMVDRLHQNGIAVILDIVWNHFSPSDNFLWDYNGSQIYFDDPAFDTQWGAQADFDRWEVADYFADSARVWTDIYHMDGFRMDATDFMRSPNGQSSGWGLMQRFNNELDCRAAHKIAIAEHLPDDYYATRPTSQGGAGFDAQYHDRYKYALRDAIYAAATGDPDMTELKNCIVGDLNDGHNMYDVGQSPAKLYRYFELHDECWGENDKSRLVTQIDTTSPHDDQYARGRTLFGHGLTMFIPGIPAFLQGAEFLEDTAFGSDAPYTPEAQLDWTKPATYANYMQAFRDMIRIRKTNNALRADGGVQVNHLNDSDNIMTIHRWDGAGNDILVVASLNNNDKNSYRVGFPQGGRWYELFNSQASCYGGNGSGNGGFVDTSADGYDGYGQSAYITVPRMSISVFRYNDPPEGWGNGDLDNDGDVDLADCALFQACMANGSSCTVDADLDNDEDIDTGDWAILEGNLTGPQ